MAKLKTCKDCGKEVSKSAKVCPSCGKKQKIPTWMIVLLVIIGISVLANLGDDSSDDNNKYEKNTKNEVLVVDFSEMTEDSITNWCDTNKINCQMGENYSNTVANGGYIDQSVEAGKKVYEGEKITITYSLGKEPTTAQKNALKSAQSYLRSSSFSYKGLISQLEYEEYSYDDAKYAVDNCGADWNEQAYKTAKAYLKSSSFSLKSLISQLEYEKFTKEEAKYGAEKAYNEQ